MNHYVKFPEMWRHILCNRPSTAADWKIACELLQRARFSPVVKLSNKPAAKMGVCSKTRLRSLNRLESWGLIIVKRQLGRASHIRVLWLAGRQPSDPRLIARTTQAVEG